MPKSIVLCAVMALISVTACTERGARVLQPTDAALALDVDAGSTVPGDAGRAIDAGDTLDDVVV